MQVWRQITAMSVTKQHQCSLRRKGKCRHVKRLILQQARK